MRVEEKFILNTNNIRIRLFKSQKTLDILDKSEIAVVPSRWEEPFGRAAMEASSSGCATIISNTGGLLKQELFIILIK